MASIRIFLLLGFVSVFSVSHAQNTMGAITSCKEDLESGREAVKALLSDSEQKGFRSQAGIEGLTGEQIQYVGNEQTCQSINSLIYSSPELKSAASGHTRSYYSAGDYYFVVFTSQRAEEALIVVLRNNFSLAGKLNMGGVSSRSKG